MMEKTLKCTSLKVDISDIDLKPGPFTMSFNFNLEPLKASIDKFGVLNPPYLLKNSDSTFSVVAGYRRLLAVRELGWPDIHCKIVPDPFPPLKALLLNLNDNLIHRQLNNIEKGMILKRLTRFLKEEEIVSDFMPTLGIPANKPTLTLFLGLEELEESIRISVAMERLSLRVAGLMLGIGRDDRLRINDLFTSLKFSFNRQWEITQWIMEITKREGLSISEVIDKGDIIEVLNNDRINNPQKVKLIVEILRSKRFPSLLEAERLFRQGLSNLRLPSGVKIIPPPFFEGIDYRLEIVFTKGEGLKETLAGLSHLSGLERVTDLWKRIGHR
jgi:hypothetical protein